MESLRSENIDASTRNDTEAALNRILADTMAFGLSAEASTKERIEQSSALDAVRQQVLA